MPRRKNEFSESDKIKVLLWCARHCCLCGKPAGVGIEVAHLDPTRSDIDNAMPLCFDCHAAIGHYNHEHPRGRKYSIPELKARREQVYEEHTRHLVSPVEYELYQGDSKLPRVNFRLENKGETIPARVRVAVSLRRGTNTFGHPETIGHYDGRFVWNMNPLRFVLAWFRIPDAMMRDQSPLLIARVDLTVIDEYQREHPLLPGGYVLDSSVLGRDWYYEPSEDVFGPSQRQ